MKRLAILILLASCGQYDPLISCDCETVVSKNDNQLQVRGCDGEIRSVDVPELTYQVTNQGDCF
jgi:hypothetical protein